MSKSIFQTVFALLFLLSTGAFGVVGNDDLDRICELAENGHYQEALEKHLWFHEESKKSAGMGGVRLSFALEAWVALSKKYPPAGEALRELRDKYKEILLSGNGGFDEFHDLSSINEYIGEKDETYDVFMYLHKHHPATASKVYHVAEDLLIEKKEYLICKEYMGDPIRKYEGIRHLRELELSMARENPRMNRPEFLDHADDRFVHETLKLITLLTELNRMEEAKEIQKRALIYFENKEIQNSIPSIQ